MTLEKLVEAYLSEREMDPEAKTAAEELLASFLLGFCKRMHLELAPKNDSALPAMASLGCLVNLKGFGDEVWISVAPTRAVTPDLELVGLMVRAIEEGTAVEIPTRYWRS